MCSIRDFTQRCVKGFTSHVFLDSCSLLNFTTATKYMYDLYIHTINTKAQAPFCCVHWSPVAHKENIWLQHSFMITSKQLMLFVCSLVAGWKAKCDIIGLRVTSGIFAVSCHYILSLL